MDSMHERGFHKTDFHDAKIEAAEFIEYFNTIELTAEQRAIKLEALSSIPAPCCSEYSIDTCCCPCNLAKSVWGLTHLLITERGYDADQVRSEVEAWMKFTNPSGYTGDACHSRSGCGRPFEQNGCGGMDEGRIS
jgi:hypothetical protein